MASSFGFSTNPDSKVKPLSNQPIDQHRQWNRAGEVGYFDNASRAFQTQGDWTQERSLSGANKSRAATRGSASMRIGTIAGGAPTGGYVSMGSSGPTPLSRGPEMPEVRAPLLPNALAQGVASRFTNDPAHDFKVSGVTGAALAKMMPMFAGIRRGGKPAEEEPAQEEPGTPEIGPGPTFPAIGGGSGGGGIAVRPDGRPVPYNPVYEGEVVEDQPFRPAGQIGQEVIDVPSWETSGELGRETGDRGNGVPELLPGDPDAGPNPRLGPPEGFAVESGQTTPRDPFGRTQTRAGQRAVGTRSNIVEVDSRPLGARGPKRPKDSTIPFFRAGEEEVDLAEAMRMSAAGYEYPYATRSTTR